MSSPIYNSKPDVTGADLYYAEAVAKALQAMQGGDSDDAGVVSNSSGSLDASSLMDKAIADQQEAESKQQEVVADTLRRRRLRGLENINHRI